MRVNSCQEKYLHIKSCSKHHSIQTIFHELLVNGHELGGEGLKVIDSLIAQLQSVFVVGCHVGHLRLQLAIAVTQQLCHQTLLEDWTGKINSHYLPLQDDSTL